jgi:putative toxin-antitoxin system antitoxin component (TIGR02293 family)
VNVAIDLPKLWQLAVEIFGNEDKATVWFNTQLSELENRTPAQVLESDPESVEVEAILERIEYGVFN